MRINKMIMDGQQVHIDILRSKNETPYQLTRH
jgi:hypothetical protein